LSEQTEPEFDGCRIVHKLSSGPIADVYQATQQPLGRPVLIKALSPSILPSSPFAATLEREARLLAELNHPCVPRVYDFVRRDERMWLVLEHVEGWSLAALEEKIGPLTPAAAASIALEVARALDHAHQHGVVHRDVRPANVLISDHAEVKLQNFAVATDERLPTAPELLDGSTSFGGPAYMSPEQILGEAPDPRSDLFSLGVVLYEMLSGQLPFDAPDERERTQRIRHDPPAPLGRLAPHTPASLERIVQRCLEKMAGDRFFSAVELAQALEGVLVELDTPAPRKNIARMLFDADLIASPPGGDSGAAPPLGVAPRRTSLMPALGGLLVCFGLIAVGGGAFGYFTWKNDRASTGRHGSTRLELEPRHAGYLRVVAEPWAVVFVDGQKIETTPFARPIPLAAGTHYVKLEHPDAPTERRTVTLVADETVLLDVKMNVEAPPASDAGDGGQLDAGDAGGDARPSP
jgi:serine/threonine-protein kinase